MSKSQTSKIAFIQASWHKDIVEQSRLAFTEAWQAKEYDPTDIDVYSVPGSLEIPLLCKHLAKSDRYAAIVAAGFIVDGGIYRHEFVSRTVLDGMMSVQLETGVPVLSVVLTPHHFNEGDEHRAFFADHFKIKGREAASACHDVLALYQHGGLERVLGAA